MANNIEKLNLSESKDNHEELTPDRPSLEIVENEKGEVDVEKIVNQVNNTVNKEQERVFETADKKIESSPASVGLSEDSATPIKQKFSEVFQDIKRRILSLGDSVKQEAMEILSNIPESFEKEKIMEEFQGKRLELLKNILTSEITSQGLNLIPWAGGGKMLVESIVGKTLSGKELIGKERIILGGIGASSIALDFVGAGEALKGGALVGKSTGLIEKLGLKFTEKGSMKSAAMFTKMLNLMNKNPEIVSKLEKLAEEKIQKFIQGTKINSSEQAAVS